jgi:hypothetical protein
MSGHDSRSTLNHAGSSLEITTSLPIFTQSQSVFMHLQSSQDSLTPPLSKVIRNSWQPINNAENSNLEYAPVLDTNAVEGLKINRYRSTGSSSLILNPEEGHLVSLIRGTARLEISSEPQPLQLGSGTHLYVPPDASAVLSFTADALAIQVSGPREQAIGQTLMVRTERFARAARDVLTPQYLSRRIFTHRDRTLVSKYKTPIAWFHTTMFDSTALPPNVEGDGVFKMSYDNQTEPNVVYEVGGKAAVRFAKHPYVTDRPGTDSHAQLWTDWCAIDGETTYYLNEAVDGIEIEHHIDPVTQQSYTLRNRHEVKIQPGDQGEPGYVSLCCLFDPGPTGLEQHQPGEYSSYAPVATILGTPEYQDFLTRMEPIDRMIDDLSLAAARGATIATLQQLPAWPIYQEQQAAQITKQQALIDQLAAAGNGRDKIVAPWRLTAEDGGLP